MVGVPRRCKRVSGAVANVNVIVPNDCEIGYDGFGWREHVQESEVAGSWAGY
jgi:hypothetical protein